MTYNQANNAIIQAYFKDEVRPFSQTFCFCGHLNDNSISWSKMSLCINLNYSFHEFKRMEIPFMNEVVSKTIGGFWHTDGEKERRIFSDADIRNIMTHSNYESALFSGISAALDVLKEIHIARGENIEEPSFTQRQLI